MKKSHRLGAGFAAVAVFGFNAAALNAQEIAGWHGDLTTLDIARALDLNLVKFHASIAAGNGEDSGLTLDYWVESLQPDGSKSIEDKTAIGLGHQGRADVTIRLPNEMNGEFGVFSEVNSSRGKSKLTVNTETQGSEGWLYNSDRLIDSEGDTIVAVRVVGAEKVVFEVKIEDSLQKILRGKFNRVDVFKVRVRPASQQKKS